jgi:hypothetical protein
MIETGFEGFPLGVLDGTPTFTNEKRRLLSISSACRHLKICLPKCPFCSNAQVLQDKPDAVLIIGVSKTEGTRRETSNEISCVHASRIWNRCRNRHPIHTWVGRIIRLWTKIVSIWIKRLEISQHLLSRPWRACGNSMYGAPSMIIDMMIWWILVSTRLTISRGRWSGRITWPLLLVLWLPIVALRMSRWLILLTSLAIRIDLWLMRIRVI